MIPLFSLSSKIISVCMKAPLQSRRQRVLRLMNKLINHCRDVNQFIDYKQIIAVLLTLIFQNSWRYCNFIFSRQMDTYDLFLVPHHITLTLPHSLLFSGQDSHPWSMLTKKLHKSSDSAQIFTVLAKRLRYIYGRKCHVCTPREETRLLVIHCHLVRR